jgi:hypothetical protein
VGALGGAILIGNVRQTAAYLPLAQNAGARRTYEVILLRLPPRLEDSTSGVILGLLSEPALSRRGP